MTPGGWTPGLGRGSGAAAGRDTSVTNRAIFQGKHRSDLGRYHVGPAGMAQLTVLNNTSLSDKAASHQPLDEAERRRIARALAKEVRGEVRFGQHDRLLYATDASLYQVEPLGVVVPDSIEDALRAVRFCAGQGLPILPRGGGTSLAGQCTNRAVVIDFSSRCTRLLEVDAKAGRCRVEPGITVDDLNDELAPRGLFFAPDPATSRHANIGGCIGNNAAGSHSVRYGRTSESLLGVDVALADGSRVRLAEGEASRDPRVAELTRRVVDVVRRHEGLIRERFPKTIRRNAGYALDMILEDLDEGNGDLDRVNLAHLICGSEGTLAVTLGAELALRPVPRSKALAVVGFATLEEAIDAVGPILQTQPAAIELLDDMVIGLARANTEYRRYVDLLPAPPGESVAAVLYVEYFSESPPEQSAEEFGERFAALRSKYGDAAVKVSTTPNDMANAWKLRKAGEPLLHGVPGNRKPITFVEDNAVPVERLGEFVREFKRIVAEHGTSAAYYAHASVGVLHVRPLLDIKDDEDRVRMREISREVAVLARSLGGVMSGEHGDGRVRSPLLEDFYGPELMGAFREIKAIFDPKNLLNPGNVVEPGPLETVTEHLRVRPERREVRVAATETYFDYSDQHGFDGAVEMCNGAGVCRKKSGGTMCPSYMGTLDERHSTRGRGNALRLAISGQFARDQKSGEPAWHDEETHRTLNLCLSCKACKSECPSNVDIARLKAEYLAQGYKARGGPPLTARFFGMVRPLSRMGSLTPHLANFMNNTPPARWVLERVLGIDRRRSLMPFARSLAKAFPREDQRLDSARSVEDSDREMPTVALFGDCFSMYNEPDVGLAAKRLLEAFGYRVVLPRTGCCARPMISNGLLEDAVSTIDATMAQLRPWIEDEGIEAVLFLEPSCLSAVTDDWLQLKTSTPLETKRGLASRSMMVEAFLSERWQDHPRVPGFQTDRLPERVVFHGHCHQKALWGNESSTALLHRILGERLDVLDAGCCGMAGAFGYTKDRFDLSMRIGERVLLPAARAAGPGDVVVAPGTSCRHQIHDGARVRALHPVELCATLLEEQPEG